MSRIAPLVVAVAMAATTIALVATPAAADAEPWGFAYLEPRPGSPGEEIEFLLFSQEYWDSPADTPLPADMSRCNGHPLYRLPLQPPERARAELYTTQGELVAVQRRADVYPTPELDLAIPGATTTTTTVPPISGRTRFEPLQIPDGLDPGLYVVRAVCTVDGETHSACAEYEVRATTAGRRPQPPEGPLGTPLINDPCPVSFRLVLVASLLRAQARLGGLGGRLFPPPPIAAPTTTLPTTTTTRRPVTTTAPTLPPTTTTPPTEPLPTPTPCVPPPCVNKKLPCPTC